MNEPFLEPLLSKMRIAKVLPIIKQYNNCSLLDIGCGKEVKLLKTVEPYISLGIGIDFKAPDISWSNGGKLQTISYKLKKNCPLKIIVLMWLRC